MLRLFTAIAIPEDVAETLARRQSGLPGARWRPLEFDISARSSISITTVRMSPRVEARRSPTSDMGWLVQSEAEASGRTGW